MEDRKTVRKEKGQKWGRDREGWLCLPHLLGQRSALSLQDQVGRRTYSVSGQSLSAIGRCRQTSGAEQEQSSTV